MVGASTDVNVAFRQSWRDVEGFILDEKQRGAGAEPTSPLISFTRRECFFKGAGKWARWGKLKSRVRSEGISPGGRFERIRELSLAPEGCPGERLDSFWISQEEELRQRVGVNLAKKKKMFLACISLGIVMSALHWQLVLTETRRLLSKHPGGGMPE